MISVCDHGSSADSRTTNRSLVSGIISCNRSWSWFVAALGALVLTGVFPERARADGFVAPKGTIWLKAGYRHWSADRTFAGPADYKPDGSVELGDPVKFDSREGGEVELNAFEVQAEYVPIPRLVIGTYMPVFQGVRFQNANFVTETQGTGDIRPYVGYQITPSEGVASTTLYVRPKIPTTPIDTSFLSAPLSEGQFDLGFEQVTTWKPFPKLQFTGATLFRYRFPGTFPDSGEGYKPGNETVVRAIVGGAPVRTLWLKGGYRGLWSTGWENREEPGPERSTFRAYQQVLGGAYWNFGAFLGGPADGLAVDLSASWPFTGRDYPQGLTWAAGLAWSTRLGE